MKIVLRNRVEYPVLQESETCYMIRVIGVDVWLSKATTDVIES